MKTIRIILIVAVAGALAATAVWWMVGRNEAPDPRFQLTETKISGIRSIVQLATVEVMRDVPVRARVGSRHLVGSMTLKGQVAFDLEKLEISMRGDTLTVTLPEPEITLRESTAPNAYRVFDSWNDYPLMPAAFTTDEENRAKQQAVSAEIERLRSDGTTLTARRRAVESLSRLIGTFHTGVTVICDAY